MPTPEVALLLVNLAATLYMTGLVWFVQVVHYPLFGQVGKPGFAGYEAAHTRLTTFVVAPPMLVEALTAVLLLSVRPRFAPTAAMAAGTALVALLWLSTFLVQVPRHGVLAAGYNARAHSVLVATNWLRTAAWSARAVLLLWVVARGLGAPAE